MVGFFICIGHSFLDIVLVLSLIFGTGPFISNTTIVVLIGLVGGGILVFFGITLLKDLKSEKIDFNFLNAVDTESENLIKSEKSDHKSNKIQNLSKPPIIRGVLISMSNPYWWLWCAVIGLNLMTQFSVTLANQINFWSFFLGHEAGDFIWYYSTETVIGFSNRFITKKIYMEL